jgi:hypothetical protein
MLIPTAREAGRWSNHSARCSHDPRLTTHLLSQHDGMSSQGSPPDSGNRKQLADPSKEGRRLVQLDLLHVLVVNRVEVTCGLQFDESESLERSVGLLITTLLDQPTRRLGTEEDTECEGKSRDERGCELKPPVGDDHVGSEPEEDTKSGPQLPAHDEGAAVRHKQAGESATSPSEASHIHPLTLESKQESFQLRK